MTYIKRASTSGLGFIPLVLALEFGKKLAGFLGISESRFRTPEENLRIRKQLIEGAYTAAMQRDQAAVMQLWLWTGIPVVDGESTGIVTDAARQYAVQAVQRYYRDSGAKPLPEPWGSAILGVASGSGPRINGLPPVPGTFEGTGLTIPGTNTTIGQSTISTGVAVGIGAMLLFGLFGPTRPARR
jgi:hypothetical protein